MATWRENEMGRRPARIANCSGFCGDPAEEMYNQATLGHVDFITGDYLAEVNMAANAEAYAAGKHPGYEVSAWEGFVQTIDVINQKRIKVAINGGALNPQGLAAKINAQIRVRNLDLRVAYLSGDNLLPEVLRAEPHNAASIGPHIDSANPSITPECHTTALLNSGKLPISIVAANAYLGARGIVRAFQAGADIVICGRVSDASPVIAASWYWHSWAETDYDRLAGSLIAGHLIECSAYVTGANFAGFTNYSQELLINPGFPIAEVYNDGSCVVTKHDGTGGVINTDTVTCQLLYELQGNIYLHSDCHAILDDVAVHQVGPDRVRVTGIRGGPPPPTTKVAVFYKAGFMYQRLINANGYGFSEKCDLFEKQVRSLMDEETMEQLDILDFQRIGVPAYNPSDQNSDTMYLRVLVVGREEITVRKAMRAFSRISLRHFSGYHASLDYRTALPKEFLAYYPTLWKQTLLDEKVHLLDRDTSQVRNVLAAGHPPSFWEIGIRHSYDTASPRTFAGPYRMVPLGDVVLARSGDKGPNLNVGFFVSSESRWEWLRSFLSLAKMKELVGKDWKDTFHVERVEFPKIHAVHFVIYGILGRGVTSSTRLDGLGKGFADYIRNKIVAIPDAIISGHGRPHA
ncbi:hypothetical protein LCI18_014105 [Fusarium solani-melongenae]|uniref:Uncharacterized protein n=1 Tax=Fusarium solani subsp. cucurbitae TaxID=2747967 RepID=A0ACD3ZPL2_FUSSC|nr:hypothetical protein LCI18_014105 [Fusarium solani-melongenae]